MRAFSIRRRPLPFLGSDDSANRGAPAPKKNAQQKNLAITRRFKLKARKEIPHAKDHFVA